MAGSRSARRSAPRRAAACGGRPVDVDRVGEAVLGVGEQRRASAWSPIGRCRAVKRAIVLAAAVADGRLLEHVAERVDLERQRVLDARVGRVALVVVAEGLARMGEEDGVAVGAPGLQARMVKFCSVTV